jgi:hypothetical protein
LRFSDLTIAQAEELLKQKEFLIDYTNYKGKRRWRRVMPIRISWDISPFHESHGLSLFLNAIDVEECTSRDFLIKDIHDVQLVQQNTLDNRFE